MLDRLAFIRSAQAVGLSLGEIRGIVALRDDGQTPCGHVLEVEALIGELSTLRSQVGSGSIAPEVARDMRRVLYGMYALVKVHFAKEEEVYLPLLDTTLAPAAASEILAAMAHVAHQTPAT